MNGYILTHSFCSSCVWGENGYYNAICAHCPYCQYGKKEEPSWMSRETADKKDIQNFPCLEFVIEKYNEFMDGFDFLCEDLA